MKTFYKQAKANEQVMHSLSKTLDTIIDEQVKRDEEQKIYGENELQTCDIDDGGPWLWERTGEVPPTAIPRG